ncbi:MAG TPA: DAK2 domain-containing protein [Candidatus Cryosericum sp.]|nr:DAK2 domain-containing protein [Candidatus Cryosericum sp.]
MKEIDHVQLEALFANGLANLETHKSFVNSLNVFPVPDGDTGTNMSLTLRTALDEVRKAQPTSMKEFVSALSSGSLIGARGNSGVILSQIIRGMAAAADNKTRITTADFSQMLTKASEVAYKAVVTPVEGTILTVVRRMSEHAGAVQIEDFADYLADVIAVGRQAVVETTAQLPALAEAHVVDAGAEGLVTILEGMLMGVRGEFVKTQEPGAEVQGEQRVPGQQLTYRYDTVMLVASDHLPEEQVRAKLTERGDSLVMASAGGLTKVHVHTNEPYDAIRYLMQFAPIREGRIEDMQYQTDEYTGVSAAAGATARTEPSGGCAEQEVDTAYVVVSPGPGFDEIFHKLGAHIIVSGGDTMNPPTEAFVDPIAACDAKSFLVFPNNRNIILAARQAATLLDKDVTVVESRHPVQAVAALVQLASTSPDDDRAATARAAVAATDFFSVTRATKNATVSGLTVQEGSYMLFVDDNLVATGDSVPAVLEHLKETELAWSDKSLVSVYRGAEHDQEAFDQDVAMLTQEFPDLEVQPYFGGQAFYDVVGSVE